MKTFTEHLNEANDLIFFHGTHVSNVSKIKTKGIVGHSSRKIDPRGKVWLTPRADVAMAYGAMGGEAEFISNGRGKTIPDSERAVFVIKMPQDWYNEHVVRVVNDRVAPEVSFDTDIPKQFINKVIVGDRKEVYKYL